MIGCQPDLQLTRKKRQQTLDVIKLTSNRQRQDGRMVKMLIDEPVRVIQRSQTLAANEHAPGNVTNNNLQEFPRTLRQPGNVTQSELQAPNPFPLDNENAGVKLHANKLTVSPGLALPMDLKTKINDMFGSGINKCIDFAGTGTDNHIIVNIRKSFVCVLFVEHLATRAICEKSIRLTHCLHNVATETLTQIHGPVPPHGKDS